jgi:exodeoxyribonuclease VIII
MGDIESLGKSNNAVILAIGAVEFDKTGLGRTFYMIIDPQSCVDAGLKMDVSTVMWWMQQSEEGRAAFKKPGVSLEAVLSEFTDWFPSGSTLWGNGATFDNAILSNAYRAVGFEQPWNFRNDRCYRTLKSLYPHIKMDHSGTHHNALDDAKSQALHAVRLLQECKVV